MRGYDIFLQQSDEHLAKEPTTLRLGYVLDAMGNPMPQLELEADDGLTNSIWLDAQMLEDIMRSCLDLMHELEISQ